MTHFFCRDRAAVARDCSVAPIVFMLLALVFAPMVCLHAAIAYFEGHAATAGEVTPQLSPARAAAPPSHG